MGEAILTVVVLVASFGCIVSSDSVVVKPIEKKITRLSCYQCLEYQPYCIALTNQSERAICELGETFCKVQRLDFQGELHVRTFKRSCSSSCEAGCEKAGDYTRCTSCCNSTLCNTDNAANSAHYSVMTGTSSIPLMLSLYIIGQEKLWISPKH